MYLPISVETRGQVHFVCVDKAAPPLRWTLHLEASYRIYTVHPCSYLFLCLSLHWAAPVDWTATSPLTGTWRKVLGKLLFFCQYQYCVAKVNHVRAEQILRLLQYWQYENVVGIVGNDKKKTEQVNFMVTPCIKQCWNLFITNWCT